MSSDVKSDLGSNRYYVYAVCVYEGKGGGGLYVCYDNLTRTFESGFISCK